MATSSAASNSGADTLGDCRIALRRLGALGVLACVERVARLFGADVPRTVEERNDIIDSWADGDETEAVLEEADRDITPLVADLETKLEAFVSRQGFLGDANR